MISAADLTLRLKPLMHFAKTRRAAVPPLRSARERQPYECERRRCEYRLLALGSRRTASSGTMIAGTASPGSYGRKRSACFCCVAVAVSSRRSERSGLLNLGKARSRKLRNIPLRRQKSPPLRRWLSSRTMSWRPARQGPLRKSFRPAPRCWHPETSREASLLTHTTIAGGRIILPSSINWR
jgi:hypothetical protein